MKARHLILAVLLLALPGVYSAQQFDSINNHCPGEYYLFPCDPIQLGDGTLLNMNAMYKLDEEGFPYLGGEYGYRYYWISPTGGSVLDSVDQEDLDFRTQLLGRLRHPENTNPDYPNVKARARDVEQGCNLEIAFFDDALSFCPETVTVNISDTSVVMGEFGGWLLDSNDDIIIQYCIPSRRETHFAKYGLDGSLKCENILPDSILPVYTNSGFGSEWYPVGLSQRSESPVIYEYYGGWPMDNYNTALDHTDAFLFDESMNLVHTYRLLGYGTPLPSLMVWPNDPMATMEGGGCLALRELFMHPLSNSAGVAVAKHDEDSNLTDTLMLIYPNTSAISPMGLLRSNDGCFFVAFHRFFTYGERKEDFVIMKVDRDLNVIWQRCGLESYRTSFQRFLTGMKVLDDGSLALYGENDVLYTSPVSYGLFLLLLDPEGMGILGSEDVLRPFFCYPNPVDDRFHVSYSPDVKPERVELFDLQGRLLRSQGNPTADIDMGNLPAGTYTVRISLDNGKTYSEKVMKK